MLRSWRLCQFKSVTERVDLKIAPLTVFTGANSSGKSTIIQSMLLTAQTMQSPIFNRPIVLNGHMSRLGSFTDLVSGGEENAEILIGFELVVPEVNSLGVASNRMARHHQYFFRRGQSVEKVSAQFAFSARPGENDFTEKDLLLLQPSLTESSVEVEYEEEGRSQRDSMHIVRGSEAIVARLRSLKLAEAVLDPADVESLQYEVVRAPKRGYSGRLEGLSIKTDAVGVQLMHFLPRTITSRYDDVAVEVNQQIALLLDPGAYRSKLRRNVPTKVPAAAAEFIVSSVRAALATSEDPPGRSLRGHHYLAKVLDSFSVSHDLKDFQRLYEGGLSRELSFLFSTMRSERSALERLLRNDRPPKYALENVYPSDQLQAGLEYVHHYFLRSVKYLGPLRDEPKPVYPLVGSSDPADVGFKGEHTAAVLHVHKNSVVEYVPASRFSEGGDFEGVPASLAEAVQDWLCYMGVGREFVTSDLGKLGHELKIMTDGSSLRHDLTQVGVGVSQVLPILVLALLAESGSTLIFEQPELHLHPRVQSRLADFFVSMTMLGKQCIVETHSEYFINRLRYRAAADEGTSIADSTAVYFVTKSGVQSQYTPIVLDELGSFSSWPPGFFDESEDATARLLKESLRKRRSKRGVAQ